jgi:hypothetical protein
MGYIKKMKNRILNTVLIITFFLLKRFAQQPYPQDKLEQDQSKNRKFLGTHVTHTDYSGVYLNGRVDLYIGPNLMTGKSISRISRTPQAFYKGPNGKYYSRKY